jgi:hypothetical protein
VAKQQGAADDELPESVKAEVEAAKKEGERAEDVPIETEAVNLPGEQESKESRRQRKERERQEERQAFVERTERAERIAEELRAGQAALAARLDAALQQRQEPAAREPSTDDVRDKYDRQMKKAKEALAAGNLDEYHERLDRAFELKHGHRAVQDARQFIPQAPQAQPQKPAWATAVESQFPDVVMHANGLNAVAAFAALDPAQLGPEKLQRAFTRARAELGLGKGTPAAPNPERERQRQMLASGPTNGGGRGSGGGRGETVLNGVPKNYREIARSAGMSPEAYLKSFAIMNPQNVSRGE